MNRTTSASPHDVPFRAYVTDSTQYPGVEEEEEDESEESLPSSPPFTPKRQFWNHPSGKARSHSSAESTQNVKALRRVSLLRAIGRWNHPGSSYAASRTSKGIPGMTSGMASAPPPRMFSSRRSFGSEEEDRGEEEEASAAESEASESSSASQACAARSSAVTGRTKPLAVAARRNRSARPSVGRSASGEEEEEEEASAESSAELSAESSAESAGSGAPPRRGTTARRVARVAAARGGSSRPRGKIARCTALRRGAGGGPPSAASAADRASGPAAAHPASARSASADAAAARAGTRRRGEARARASASASAEADADADDSGRRETRSPAAWMRAGAPIAARPETRAGVTLTKRERRAGHATVARAESEENFGCCGVERSARGGGECMEWNRP